MLMRRAEDPLSFLHISDVAFYSEQWQIIQANIKLKPASILAQML
jgi:hypothetical protein